MRFLLTIIVLLALCSVPAFAGDEDTEYARNPEAGELYYVNIEKIEGISTQTQTNKQEYMWCPARIDLVYPAGHASTTTVDHIWAHTSVAYTESQVVTNEFGSIATNWLHGAPVTTTMYITNRIATITQAANTAGSVALSNVYIQASDLLLWTFSNTNVMWRKITARR